MADDLLIGVGADVAGFRRDRAAILSEAQGLQRDITTALRGAQIIPDLGAQARTAGTSVVTGIREAIQGGAGDLRRDVADALVPQSLATDVAALRTTVRSGISGVSRDFASEGAESGASFVSALRRGLADADTAFSGLARDVSSTLQGSQGLLGNLAPEAERASRDLVTGLVRGINRESETLRASVTASLIPSDMSGTFAPVIKGADDAETAIVAALGAAGVSGAARLTSGLTVGLGKALAAVNAFSQTAAGSLERANLLAGLATQGTQAGRDLVRGVTVAITAGAGDIRRSVSTALVPASLPTDLRAITAAVTAETARLLPVLATTGTEGGRALITSLSTELTQGTRAVVTGFAQGASKALTATNLLGDVTPVGERAGEQLAVGVQRVITQQSRALRTTITAAIVPTGIGTELAGLETSLTSSLARFPALFRAAGVDSGGQLVAGITSQLRTGQEVLTTFATDTSRALTAALTIGDVSGVGERAGRLLAASVATGIAAGAPEVQAALGAAFVPRALIGQIAKVVDTVEAEAAQLVPALGATGQEAGRAIAAGVVEGISTARREFAQLTTGETIGIVVDPTPIREATTAQQDFATATENATTALRGEATAAEAPFARFIADAKGATVEIRGIADAQREWVKETRGASVEQQALWQRQRNEAAQAQAESRRASDQAKRDAAEELAARAQVRAELANEISTLATYGRTVDATSAEAVAAWRKEAAEIRAQAADVGLSRDQLLKLDDVIKRTERSFARQQQAAERAAAALAENASAGVGKGVGNIGADLSVLSREANAAKRSVDQVSIGGKSMQQVMSRLGPVVVGVGFGLEALARGGESADAGLRTVLRSIASFAAFFGPEGLVVSGVAAATAAVIDLFDKTREEIQKTRETFVNEVNRMAASGDIKGLRQKFIDLDVGLPDITKGGKLTGGVVELSRELDAAEKKLRDMGKLPLLKLLDPRVPAQIFLAQQNIEKLRARLVEAQDESRQLAELQKNPTDAMKKALAEEAANAAKKAIEEANRQIRELTSSVSNTVRAWAQLTSSTSDQAKVASTLPGLYDRVTAALARQKNLASDNAIALREAQRTLADTATVQVELARRKFGNTIPEIPPLKVTAIVDRIEVPKAAAQLTVPVEFDASKLNDGLRQAISGLSGAQNKKVFAELFGTRQQIADATENVNIEIANLTKTFRAAIDAELASADADTVKAQRIKVVIDAAKELGIDLLASSKNARDFASTMADIGGAARGVADVTRELRGADDELTRVIESAGRAADAISALGNLKLKDIFGSVGGFLKSIPVIGEAIASAINLGKTAFNAITGKDVKDANNAILQENTDQLEKLREDLKGFDDSIGQLLGVSRVIDSSSILTARLATSGAGRGFRDVEPLDRELRAAGSSIAELKRRAAEFGITITDAKGRISASGLKELAEATRLAVEALLHFKNTIEDQSFIDEARRQIFNQTDASSVAKDWLDELRKFAPQVAAKFFGGADAATAGGRQAFRTGLQDAFNAAVAGKIPDDVLAAFGGIKDFINFLLSADGALDSFADTAKQASGEMTNIVRGFRDFNLERARFMATANDAVSQTTLAGKAPTPAPTPLPVGAGGMAPTTSATVTFAPTIRIDGRDKDAVQITDEVVTELRRRAKASANKDVRRTVELLPA